MIYVLPDGRQIVILSDRAAKLLALDGSPLYYMTNEIVVMETKPQLTIMSWSSK